MSEEKQDFTQNICEQIYEELDFYDQQELFNYCLELYTILKISYDKKNDSDSDSDYDPNEPSDYEDD